ncbi:unnamed protein product, partial [Discosporangium mesarthrocarpum]
MVLSGAGSSSSQASKFKQGAIVRLHMHHFLSNRDTSVRFGPRLNIVIGPNGSGKSTLVCAMAIGLAVNPKVLGRSDNLSDFVMHEEDRAWVEVEIFRSDGVNTTIRRDFKRGSKKSDWLINGSYGTEKAVRQLTDELGIQMQNLCTFLPQDRVGDFSGNSPEQLLVETEKALGGAELYAKHEELIRLQESAGMSVNVERQVRERLEQLVAENDALKRDVERMQQREQHLQEISLLQKRKLWIHLEELKAKGIQANQRKKEADAELKAEAEKHAPLEVKVVKWQKQQDKARGNFQCFSNENKKIQETLEQSLQDVADRCLSAAKTAKVELKNLESRSKNRRDILQNKVSQKKESERELADMKEKAARKRSATDLAKDMSDLEEKINECEGKIQVQQGIWRDVEHSMKEAEQKLRHLKNIRTQRSQALIRKFGRNGELGLEVATWAKRNSDKLRGQVWGPVALEVDVADEAAASCLEHQVAGYIWFSVVVECIEDQNTIIKAFQNDNRQLNIITCQHGRLRDIRGPYSEETMAHLKHTAGVRGYMDEFFTSEDAIREILRSNSGVHSAILGNQETEQLIQRDKN